MNRRELLEARGRAPYTSFNLVGVSFKYAPMQTWPRWPSPPIVEVTALRAEFENGDYLALAEDLTHHRSPPHHSRPRDPQRQAARLLQKCSLRNKDGVESN
ncbi:MAG: hypothetical protein H7Y20_02650 [Bryobacteraceae bacterium]|nr:hypothetical protein [Bryobacteraceae bacterium]